MGQPIKNIVNYEKYFSKELTDLLTYIKDDMLKTLPMTGIPTEMFFAAALSIQDTILYKVINSYLNTFSITNLQNKFMCVLQEKSLSTIKPGRTVDYGQELKNLFNKSYNECLKQNLSYITSDHILLALLNEGNCKSKSFFLEENVDYKIASDYSMKIHNIMSDVVESVEKEENTENNNDTEETYVKTLL
jgi:ATP-dependent Clp protease ATP-binding subunit ClpA